MIQGISAGDSFPGSNQVTGSNDLGKDAFMSLLVEQMKNQDPMAPTSNDEFIAQLAQFSSLEEMQVVNENLVALALLQQDNALMAQLTDSSALIGKQVVYMDPETSEPATGTVEAVKLAEGAVSLLVDGKEISLASVSEITGNPDQSGDSGDSDEDSEEDSEEHGNHGPFRGTQLDRSVSIVGVENTEQQPEHGHREEVAHRGHAADSRAHVPFESVARS